MVPSNSTMSSSASSSASSPSSSSKQQDMSSLSPSSSSWKKYLMGFFSQYFLEGQLLVANEQQQQQQRSSSTSSSSTPVSFWTKYRKRIAILFPALIVHTIWWSIMISHDLFYLFGTATSRNDGGESPPPLDKPRYLMSITMVFGSMVAGATSEGGGAVAFPVMTLVLGIAPIVARDFAFMIQSVGMVASSFTILTMRLQLEWNALVYVSLGGIVGIVVGLEYVAPRLAPAYSKMYFVVIWSSFAIGLFLLNRHYDRTTWPHIQNWNQGILWQYNNNHNNRSCLSSCLTINWKRECLFAFGVLGGIFSSMAGSGIDICSFSALTLLFRVSEKVATPTSVILMAINTTIGFAYRQFAMGGVESEAWGYFAVCVPVVVFGAPLGAFLGSYAHRLTLASVIYVIDAAQLIGALVVIQPWTTTKTNTPLHLTLTSLALFVSGLIFFHFLSYAGLKMLEKQLQEQEHEDDEAGSNNKQQLDITVDDILMEEEQLEKDNDKKRVADTQHGSSTLEPSSSDVWNSGSPGEDVC